MCCVHAGHVAEGVAAKRHIHTSYVQNNACYTSVVDRSNNSPFYIIAFGAVLVFIVLSVLGLQ